MCRSNRLSGSLSGSGSSRIEDIRNLRTIIGKRFYAVENPDFSEDGDEDDEFFIKIE